MTDEEINIAVAECCDLFWLAPLKRTTRKGKDNPKGVVLWYCSEDNGGAKTYDKIPNYCNDLNAVHEAEKVLTDDQHNDFTAWLVRLFGSRSRSVVSVTARQRAEALLRVKGKWKE